MRKGVKPNLKTNRTTKLCRLIYDFLLTMVQYQTRNRVVSLDWKQKLNTNINWQFEGTKDYDGKPLEWNFTKIYRLLMYYRVK